MTPELLLGRYRIGQRVSECGETVVYLGEDVTTGERVSIREFFADAIMQRTEEGGIAVRPGREVQYKSLSSDYEELYRLVMGLSSLRGIVAPKDVFWCGKTVYAVEEFTEDQTLDDALARRGEPMSWLQLKKAIAPIVRAVTRLHEEGFYHRGISPETISVGADGSWRLSGFCIPAARTADSEIASTLYFGYSAPEQYSSNSWQGSWTDVYSLAAICYRALTGVMPVEWRQRGSGRELVYPRAIVPDLPENIANALMTALSVDIRSRYRTVEEFWFGMLHGPGDGSTTRQFPIERRSEPSRAPLWNGRIAAIVAAIMVVVLALSVNTVRMLIDRYVGPDDPVVSSSAPAEPSSSEEPSSEPLQEESLTPNFTGIGIERVLMDPYFRQMFTFTIEHVFSEQYPVGNVISQQPASGEPMGENSHVVLYVSKGTERTLMPKVLGETMENARMILESAEIEYQMEWIVDFDSPPDIIVWTSHDENSIIYRTVDIVTIRATRSY